MAELSPTAANIISSLGILGATVDQPKPGYVPVLDENGKLCADFMPVSESQLSMPRLSNVAFVDVYTEIAEGLRSGTIAAPYKSLQEAADGFTMSMEAGNSSARHLALVLSPGTYPESGIIFSNHASRDQPLHLYIICLGKCRFTADVFTVGGMGNFNDGNITVVLQNFSSDHTVNVANDAVVTLLGDTYINVLSYNPVSCSVSLKLASEARVNATNIGNITYLSEATRVGYSRSETSYGIPSGTVAKELYRLGHRKIRVSKISAESSGLEIGSSSYVDISADSDSGQDTFDLQTRDRIFVEAINRLYEREHELDIDAISATTITADVVKTKELQMDSLVIGGYKLTIDSYGYLVLMESSESPVEPPDTVILLRDSSDGAIYAIGVADERLYAQNVDAGDSSYGPPMPYFDIFDGDSGYRLTMSGGRLVISKMDSGSSSPSSSGSSSSPTDQGE